jgi:hypothetical protein
MVDLRERIVAELGVKPAIEPAAEIRRALPVTRLDGWWRPDP